MAWMDGLVPFFHPRDWYITLHFHTFSIKIQPDVGKYTSPIDGNWGKFSFPVRI